MVMEDSVEEALMFVGRGSFGLCRQLVSKTGLKKGVDKSCGRSDSRSDMVPAVLTNDLSELNWTKYVHGYFRIRMWFRG